MAEQIKVTFSSIKVNNNGEGSGKGELYWDMLVDGQPLGGDGNRSISNARKTADGEMIVLNAASRTVSKEAGQRLVVEGSVSDKDDLSKDESTGFSDTYDSHNNWGIGSYSRILRDRKLDVVVSYQVARV
jgi:hypothetical protein